MSAVRPAYFSDFTALLSGVMTLYIASRVFHASATQFGTGDTFTALAVAMSGLIFTLIGLAFVVPGWRLAILSASRKLGGRLLFIFGLAIWAVHGFRRDSDVF